MWVLKIPELSMICKQTLRFQPNIMFPLKENKRDADGSASTIACFPAYPQSQPTRPQNSLAAKIHSWLPSDRCERFRVILVGQFQNSSHPPSTPPSSIISLGNSLTLTRASVQFCVSWRPIIRWVKCIYTGKSGRSVQPVIDGEKTKAHGSSEA